MTSPRVRGIIFDLDGTLIDSYDAIADSLNHALARLDEPTIPPPTVRGMVGRGLESLLAQALRRPDPARVAEGIRLFRERYERICLKRTRALPGVPETLAALRRRGYRMGIASNKPARFSREILRHLGLEGHLDGVLGPDVVERPKPHPEMVNRLLGILGVGPEEAVYVGDMGVDVETCRGAGVPCWLLPTGSCSLKELRAAGGDRLLGSFADLLDLLPPLSS